MTTLVIELTSKLCVECGSPFSYRKRRGRARLTCSPLCRARRLAVLADQRAADACPTCGASRKHWQATYKDVQIVGL
jgi:hypothetical protein